MNYDTDTDLYDINSENKIYLSICVYVTQIILIKYYFTWNTVAAMRIPEKKPKSRAFCNIFLILFTYLIIVWSV